jgi:hypothetical protein
MENGVAILWKNYLQLSVKNSCKKQINWELGLERIQISLLVIKSTKQQVTLAVPISTASPNILFSFFMSGSIKAFKYAFLYSLMLLLCNTIMITYTFSITFMKFLTQF